MDDQTARVLNILNKCYPLKLFTDLQKEEIAAHANVEVIEEGHIIYRKGDEGKDLFLVISGQVHLFWMADEEDEEAGEIGLGDLEPGDLFGLEMLDEDRPYRTNACALTLARVVRFNYDFLDPYFEENSIPYHALQVLLSSFNLYFQVDLPWRNPEEAIVFMSRRSVVFLYYRLVLPVPIFLASVIFLMIQILVNLPGTLLIGIIAGVVALLSGLWSIWSYVDWSNDYAIVTNQRAIFQELVIMLYESREEAPLEAILATSIDTSQIGRILGYGDVILRTYTGTLIFNHLANYEMARAIVDDRRARARDANIQQEKRTMQTMVRQRLRLAPPSTPAGKAEKKEPRQISLGERIANFFRMRQEKNGVITYRKHWFILLRKATIPALVELGVLILPLLRLFRILVLFPDLAFWSVWLVAALASSFWLWYRFEDWVNDIYIVSDEQIIDIYKKPLGQEDKRVAPLKSIQSVEYERLGIIGLVLNFGTVYLLIGDTRFTFDDVYNPSEVQRDLFRRIAAQADRETRKEVERERERILDVIEAYHEVISHPSPPAENPDSESAGTPRT